MRCKNGRTGWSCLNGSFFIFAEKYLQNQEEENSKSLEKLDWNNTPIENINVSLNQKYGFWNKLTTSNILSDQIATTDNVLNHQHKKTLIPERFVVDIFITDSFLK